MNRFLFVLLFLLTVRTDGGFPQSPRVESGPAYRALPNLLQNPDFEADWQHNGVTARSRFYLLEQSDWGYAQADALPDGWVCPSTAALDTQAAKFGRASLRLSGAASQVVYLCGETDPRDGGAFYNPFQPLPPELSRYIGQGTLRFGVWCRTEYAWEKPSLSVTLEYARSGKVETRAKTVLFETGTRDWEYREVVFPPVPELGPASAAVVRLEHRGRGTAWFDGARAVEERSETGANLLPDGDFRDPTKNWTPPALWTWSRREYYRFTGWTHGKGVLGAARYVPAGNGTHTLELTVRPGENLAVRTRPVRLNQPAARPLEVRAWVWAEDLRWMEIMAQDETGMWLPQTDFAGMMGTDEQYRNRLVGAGAHGWEYVRKWYAPRRPVKGLTLWLCARGMDGRLMGRRPVGRVRFAGLRLYEAGATLAGLRQRGVSARLTAVPPPPGPVPFHAAPARPALAVRLSGVYLYPAEKLEAGIHVTASPQALREGALCRVTVRHPGGEKVVLNATDVSKAFWKPDTARPALLAEGHVDARNLLTVQVGAEGMPVHPSADPVRDCRLVVTLADRQGREVARSVSEPFGFMQQPGAAVLPDRIRRTEVTTGGVLRVNGRPFTFNLFPYEKTDLGGIHRTLNFPKTHKILALPMPGDVIIPADQEAEWKRKVQAFVQENRTDPKLFGYTFGHGGEVTFGMEDWRGAALSLRKAAGWAREVDRDHVIMSADWLLGHRALTGETARAFDFLDVVDVEMSATWIGDARGARQTAGRPVCYIGGLECFFGEPPARIRWRTYEALRWGFNGIGLCPSGMLSARPETVSYLRGLYAEVAVLEPMLTASPPPRLSACDRPEVTLWERQAGRTRWIVALCGLDAPGVVVVTLPSQARRAHVLFEGRDVSIAGGKLTDRFATPFAVHVYRIEESAP